MWGPVLSPKGAPGLRWVLLAWLYWELGRVPEWRGQALGSVKTYLPPSGLSPKLSL